MKRIDGISYPDTVKAIMKDRKLSKVFFSHLQDEQAPELGLFWMAPANPKWCTRISSGGACDMS